METPTFSVCKDLHQVKKTCFFREIQFLFDLCNTLSSSSITFEGLIEYFDVPTNLLVLKINSLLNRHSVNKQQSKKVKNSVVEITYKAKSSFYLTEIISMTTKGYRLLHVWVGLLEHGRAKHRITMFYKIINNLANIPVHHQLKVHDSSTRGSTSHKYKQLNTKLSCYKYSFLPATIVSWNTLPLEVRQLPSLEQFQHAISKISVSSLV